MKKRIITALLISAIVLPIVLLGGIPYFIGVLALMGICMYEITKVNKSPLLTQLLAITFVLSSAVYSYFNISNSFINFNLLFLFIPFITYFTISMFSKEGTLLDACYNSIMTIIFSLFATGLLELRYTFDNANLLTYAVIVTTSVDTFALFVGCKLGKHRLNERISPKKSIEGSIGGIVGGTILASLFSMFFPLFNEGNINYLNLSFSTNIVWINVLYSFIITVLLTFIGQIGDLIFSMIKRNYQIKDFSNILPGHGGFADRIDSLCVNTISLSLILSIFAIL